MKENIDAVVEQLRMVAKGISEIETACGDREKKTEMALSSEWWKCAADMVEKLAEREWELFDLITSVYYGKGMYFEQDDGTIYSRVSCKYMTFEQAIDEFCGRLSND